MDDYEGFCIRNRRLCAQKRDCVTIFLVDLAKTSSIPTV